MSPFHSLPCAPFVVICILPDPLAALIWISTIAASIYWRGEHNIQAVCTFLLSSHRPLFSFSRASSSPSSIALLPNESVNQFGIIEGRWKWTQKGHTIRYQRGGQDANQEKPALILLHGFGGNADHWRLNTPELSKHYRVYALDLLGYGYSDKPSPRGLPPNSIYNFENWSAQVRKFFF